MVLAVALPVLPAMVPVGVVLLLLAGIVWRWTERGRAWGKPGWKSAMPWMAFFYLWHVAGMLWTTNTAFGLFDLEVKAVLLVFPLLAILIPRHATIDTHRILHVFTLACIVSVLISLVAAGYRFGHEGDLRAQGELPADPAWTNHFFESRFSRFVHPSYSAMYLCFALALVLDRARAGVGRYMLLSALILIIGVLLCNSKAGWLVLAVVLGHALSWGALPGAQRRRLVLIAGAGLVVFAALFFAFPTVSGKITQAFGATEGIDPASDQSSQLRRMAWDSAIALFREAPLTGTGTGDIKDELLRTYHERSYVHAESRRLNAHSQFLQTAAALGLPGLLLLPLMLLVPFIRALRERRTLYALFLGISVLNWAVESMAEVQAGVVFFAAMAFLLELEHPAAMRRS